MNLFNGVNFTSTTSSNLVKGFGAKALKGLKTLEKRCKGLWKTSQQKRAVVKPPVVEKAVKKVVKKVVSNPQLISHTNKALEDFIGIKAVSPSNANERLSRPVHRAVPKPWRPAPAVPNSHPAQDSVTQMTRPAPLKKLSKNMFDFVEASLHGVTSENRRYFDDNLSACVMEKCVDAFKKGWKAEQIKAVVEQYIATLNRTLSERHVFKSLADARKFLVSSAFASLQDTFQEPLLKMSNAQCLARYKYHFGKMMIMAMAREKNWKVVATEDGFDLFKPVTPSEGSVPQPSKNEAARARRRARNTESFKRPVSPAALPDRMTTGNKIAVGLFAISEMDALSGLNSSITNESKKQMRQLSSQLIDKRLTIEQSKVVMSKVVAMLKPTEEGGFWTVDELAGCLREALTGAQTEDAIISEFYAAVERRLDDRLEELAWNDVLDKDFSDEDEDEDEDALNEKREDNTVTVKPLPNPRPEWLKHRQEVRSYA